MWRSESFKKSNELAHRKQWGILWADNKVIIHRGVLVARCYNVHHKGKGLGFRKTGRLEKESVFYLNSLTKP